MLNVRYQIHFDPDLYVRARKFALEQGISLSRLIHESLVAVVGDSLDPVLRRQIEERISRHPGRRPLTAEEKLKREQEIDKLRALREAERARQKLEKLKRQYPELGTGWNSESKS